MFNRCTLCPRNCNADRMNGKKGRCGETNEISIARAALHKWEEPCITGKRGSGTVFFSGCALGCVYCQNHKISRGEAGRKINAEELSSIFIGLQEQGAHNINLVTPSHFVPQIVETIIIAKKNGLKIPVVYNTSAYEKIETLELLEGYIQIYLPDFKYMSNEIAKKYSDAEDYFYYASNAIEEMLRQTGEAVFDENGIMTKGVIVRHLTLPGCLKDSKNIIRYLFETYGNKIHISIMNQFTPLHYFANFPELNRKIKASEYNRLVDYAISIGVENAYIQNGETASKSFIPDFD